ncbi:F-BOX/TPR REPEAT PROTEIN POF3 [Salix purpurea]|uniref:F-BOX/TPR REPEAT PROTEIN POF3 n=1 Tax=Salix purpurea TaxID=77065 RepID=A0A9Q0ZER7_SALPP|nr:F-BOX/TPR REPEAT PROTEIN POF3 [Salix purpurea]
MNGNEDTNVVETDTESRPVSDWAELTYECLINILSRLTLEHRWRGPMLVCKGWLIACKDPSLNTLFDLDTRFDSVIGSPRWWTPDFERKIDSMLRSVITFSDGSLTEIRTQHCSDHSITFAAERCPNLQVLSIKSCRNVTDASMAQIAYKCAKLKELDISFCFEISHESLVMMGIVPDDYLNSCPQDGDWEAGAIGKYMPNLVHLELRFSKMSAKGLVSVCEGCLNLEYLDLSGCSNLTSRDIVNATSGLKNLKEIKKPNFYIPRSVFHTERYGHWRLYDERFQTDIFRI